MTQFHEGQEVEILERWQVSHMKPQEAWRKAKIRHRCCDHSYAGEWWYAQFPDDTIGVFDREHIRAVEQKTEHAFGFTDELCK